MDHSGFMLITGKAMHVWEQRVNKKSLYVLLNFTVNLNLAPHKKKPSLKKVNKSIFPLSLYYFLKSFFRKEVNKSYQKLFSGNYLQLPKKSLVNSFPEKLTSDIVIFTRDSHHYPHVIF